MLEHDAFKNAAVVTLKELRKFQAPAATATWQPIEHYEFARDALAGLTKAEIPYKERCHLISSRDHGKRLAECYMGLLELDKITLTLPASVGSVNLDVILTIRNSHDKKFAAGVSIGVYDSLRACYAFYSQVSLYRRHTKNILRDLPQLLEDFHASILQELAAQAETIERLAGYEITNELFELYVCACIKERIFSPAKLAKAFTNWYGVADGNPLSLPTAWNALTAVAGVLNELDFFTVQATTMRAHSLLSAMLRNLEELYS